MKDLRYIQNILTDGEATILLYDTIGSYTNQGGKFCEGINGTEFAKEIEYLQDKATKINVRINSEGGNVIDGYSIISAIQNSKIPVETYVDGLAASIAGVIAMCGSKKHIADYGTLMLHNPSGAGGNQEILDLIKNTLVTILTNNSLLNTEQVSDLMDDETFFNPSQAIKMGLMDEVVNTNKKVKIKRNNLSDLVNIYNKLIIKNTMITVKNALELDETVTDEVIVESIEKLKADNLALSESLEAEKAAKLELQNTIDSIELEKEEAKNAEILTVVNSYVTSGKIKEEEVEALVKLAKVDFSSVKNMLSKIDTKVAVKIIDKIKTPIITNGTEGWTIRDWEKQNPSGLSKLKNETPDVYNKMFNDYYKK